MKRRILPILIALLSVWAVSCGKPEPEPNVDPEEQEKDFSIEFSISDGVIDREKTLSAPSVSFTVRSLSDEANYVVAYQVDGTETQYVRNLWGGKSRDISSSFSDFKTYGKHTLKGKIYEEDNEDEAIPFEKEIWIRYSQINVESVYFSSFAGDVHTKAATLNTSEKGILFFRFSPGISFAEFAVKSSNEGVISFNYDNPVIDSGLYGLRYTVGNVPGEASVSFSVKNAEKTLMEDAFAVTTKQGKIAPTIHVASTCHPVYFASKPIRVQPTVSIDDSSSSLGTFLATYYLDGQQVGHSEPFGTEYESVFELSSQGLQPGWHEFSMTVSSEKYIMDDVTEMAKFYVLDPILLLSHDELTEEYTPSQSIKLRTGESYAVSVKDLPTEIESNIRILDNGASTVINNESGWTLSVADFGEPSISLQIVQEESIYDEVQFQTNRQMSATLTFSIFDGKDTLSALLEYAGNKHPDVYVSGEFVHYGYGESHPTIFENGYPVYTSQPEYTDEVKVQLTSKQVTVAKTVIHDFTSLAQYYQDKEFFWPEYSDEGYGYEWYTFSDCYHLRIKAMKLIISGPDGNPLDSHIELTCKMGKNMTGSRIDYLGLDSEPTVEIIQ